MGGKGVVYTVFLPLIEIKKPHPVVNRAKTDQETSQMERRRKLRITITDVVCLLEYAAKVVPRPPLSESEQAAELQRIFPPDPPSRKRSAKAATAPPVVTPPESHRTL